MSYSYSSYVETLEQFLVRLLCINTNKLIADAIQEKMLERGLNVVSVEDCDDSYPNEKAQKITLSDGSVYIHKLVSSVGGCNWGTERFLLVKEDENVEVDRKFFDDTE